MLTPPSNPAATTTIPIVFGVAGDPVKLGCSVYPAATFDKAHAADAYEDILDEGTFELWAKLRLRATARVYHASRGAAVTWPVAAREQPAVPVVGFMSLAGVRVQNSLSAIPTRPLKYTVSIRILCRLESFWSTKSGREIKPCDTFSPWRWQRQS
jgi:hypothetical protein